jgi:quercetin dioxygenase-like cupin family protein
MAKRVIMTTIDGIIKPRRAPEPLRLLLASADSSGELGVVEMQMPPRSGGPPLHVHPTHGEGFYVLDGQLAFQIGNEIVTAGPGTWLFAPRNAPHTLANPSNQLGTLLCFFAPGGFERRFARALAQQAGESLPADLEALSEAERATKAVGPPLQI